MKRAILVDGNNLLFRSYYATAYNGNLMKNSKGFPTNAIFGFVNMINKIITEEKPQYMLVAFDKGKNFRHEKYKEYKEGRIKTPDDLLLQFPYAKNILVAMGIKYLEVENYEADDIIGTYARLALEDKDYDATIISSDKDLLQLISSDVNVKLLKQKDYILMDEKTFKDYYEVEPIRMIDLKALMGDASDNIPGVKGIGEKTAINLIKEYGSLENLYNNIDTVKGKLKDKLINDKDNAFFSKELATIYKEVPVDYSFLELKISKCDKQSLIKIYEELEFNTFIKKIKETDEVEISEGVKEETELEYSNDVKDINKPFAFYLELTNDNYHIGQIIGLSIYDGEKSYYLTEEEIIKNKDIFKYAKYTYDLKKSMVVLKKLGIDFLSVDFDVMIALYLLNKNVNDDISYVSNTSGYNINYVNTIRKKNLVNDIVLKSKFIYEQIDELNSELDKFELTKLFESIEMPLIEVLAYIEENGMCVSKKILDNMKEEILVKIDLLKDKIYNYAGTSFNISSPKQLGEILFDKLNLPYNKKKGKNGYSTSHDVLVKLKDIHPIISLILEYREVTKLYSTYIEGLSNYILPDGKIHTIFKQTIARTGRLSSTEPNLQNIPVRTEEGKLIRKAFLPEEGSLIMTSDYSQIELRVLAHISKCKSLKNAFINHEDIHTKVASDIYGVPIEQVSKSMRRTAKAVIFGIVYGISGYGLGENLEINPFEAKKYIDKYLQMYSGVKEYMDNIKKEAYQNFYVKTLFGRIRYLDELKNTNYMIRRMGERMALNTPIQGSSADIIKKAMIDVYKYFKENKLKSTMILQIHDELVFNVVKEEKEKVEKIVTELMENAYNLDVPLKVEVEFGDNWYNAK